MHIKDNTISKVIWMEGKLVPYSEAKVHVLSHSLHYGTAIFEGIRSYQTAQGGAAIFRAEEHFKRFLNSIRTLDATTHYTVSDFTRAAVDCIRANGFRDCYIRPLAYFDDITRGLQLPDKPRVLIAIAAWEWGRYMGDGQQNGIRVMVSTYRRPDVSTSMPFAKFSGGAYLTSALARRESTLNKLDEALLLDPEGFVAEGSGENIFLVKDKTLFTPPTGFILPGITRESVMQLAEELGYRVKEERISRNQLYLADELFFTGTAVEITPIVEVDRYPIGDGKPGIITREINDLFFKCVRGEVPKFKKWLTPL
ncbi:MAG: branched-chain amino acid transaminase [Deltaproteobacteria bacterium]|nr:branched-chain amino acid transaminase [Deltaproteobacteria bacterium]